MPFRQFFYRQCKKENSLFFPFILFLISFCLNRFFLIETPVSLDEPYSIYHAQFTIRAIWHQLQNGNNPPLFEILLHGWIKLFGVSSFSIRLLPCFFASLCPPALFMFARKYFSFAVSVTHYCFLFRIYFYFTPTIAESIPSLFC